MALLPASEQQGEPAADSAVVDGASTPGAVMDGAEASYTGHSRCSGSLMVALQGGQPVSAVGVEPVDLCREGSPCVAQHTSVWKQRCV